MERAMATKSTWIDDPTVRELMQKAGQGDESALAELKSHLRDRPREWKEICLIVGDLAREAEHSLIETAAGPDLLAKAAIGVKLEHMGAALLGPAPTQLERLVVQRIRACWLLLTYAENIYLSNMGSLTLAQGDYYQRMIARAERRYLAAIKSLAHIRRLGPSVQLNVGLQQVNVAG